MRIVYETGRNFATFLAARLVFVTVLLGAAALFTPAREARLWYLGLFAANTVLSLGCAEGFRRWPRAVPLRWLAMTGAVILDTLVLHITGGADSEFILLYFFTIGSAGLLTGPAGSLWTAGLSALGTAWLYYNSDGVIGMRAVVYAINFLLTAALTSYVFARLTERERTHRETLDELEQTRLDTQTILKTLSTGAILLDTAGEPVFINPAARAMLDLAGPAAYELDDRLARVLREPRLEEVYEVELELPEGPRPLRVAVSALRDPRGEEHGHVLLLSDLTRARAAERAARERERLAAIGGLSRELAHEIRNPLATVRGSIEMIQISVPAESELQPFLQIALRESDRLNRLLTDFLQFAHPGAPQKRTADLFALLRARLAPPPQGVTIRDTLPLKLETEFDEQQLRLAFDALLLALSEWAEGAGEIRLEPLPVEGCGLRLVLADKLIAPRIQAAAFEPFSSVHPTRSSLALPTAMRAVHAHGGNLTLFTEPGVGTGFELTL